MIWKKFENEKPEDSGTYNVIIVSEYGIRKEVAEYSVNRKAFIWYSRRGYPYELSDVKYWIEQPPLPEELLTGEK